MDKVIAGKGEGIMIRDPDSIYEGKRSDTLLKVKKFDDSEALVIGHNKGTGRCSGMLGALVVREKDGTEFKIGSGFDDS
jgi:DNA ligase-1